MPSPAKAIARRLLPHSVYRSYRQRKVASLIAAYPSREVTHRYGGHELRLLLADPLAEGWYDHDWEEPAAIRFLRERGVLAPGATVIDLGAHQGVIALMIARDVGEHGKVVAVEAEPHNARVAARNAELNDAANLTVVHAAGAARSGTISFAEGLNGRIDEQTARGNVEVAAVTVDDLAREHGAPALVMIDVEGYEASVLAGAERLLVARTASFLVEVHEEIVQFGAGPQQVLDRFAAYDRFVAVEDDEEPRPLEGPPPPGRFFLIAIPRPEAPSTGG